jgi:MutS domain V
MRNIQSSRRNTANTRVASRSQEGEYVRRLGERERQLVAIRDLHRRLWTYLAVTVVAGGLGISLAFSSHLISAIWIFVPFVIAALVIRSLRENGNTYGRVQRIARFYEYGLARLHDQWQGKGTDGKEFDPENHLYSSDVDLFGTGSLFEFLCTARTRVGRETLANWLLNPAECEEISVRQAAVAELRDELDLQEDWAAVEGGALEQAGGSVRDWAQDPPVVFPFYARALAIALPLCLLVMASLAGLGVFGHHWVWAIAVPVGLEGLLALLLLKETKLAVANLNLPSYELVLIAPLLRLLESTSFHCSLLKSLQSQLTSSSGCPSKQIRVLRLYAWFVERRKVEWLPLLFAPFLGGTNLSILIEHWRQQNREGLTRWLDSLGQFEALLCLARYSYENPGHTFAVVKPRDTPIFQAETLGHPLLDSETCVRCDLSLDVKGTQLMIVSGSNMSGKSTLLRSVGLNCVLALAGAPVRAARLEVSPLRIGCSIAVHDSLLRGKSRFQAEVERLTRILTLSRTNNVLFLLDEILSGTNSADRLFGARALVDRFVVNGAVGIVTTHDLALTAVATTLGGRATNVHFEEYYEDGEMRFDYRMRPGVLTRTNGANVMAALGLLSYSPKVGTLPKLEC